MILEKIIDLFRPAALNADIIVYVSQNYIVRHYLVDRGGPVYVCFDGWMPQRPESHHAFGYEFFKSRELNVIEIVCKSNDWYQSCDIQDAIRAIDKTAGGRARLGYGSSMGGYGAINFADRLRLSSVVTFSPQFSVDHRKMPGDGRWSDDIKLLTSFAHDNAFAAKSSRIILFYDPNDQLDSAHARAISSRCIHSSLIRTPFAGHVTAEFVAATGYLPDIALGLLRAELTPAGVRRKIRARRREIGFYWANASAYLAQRGNFPAALRFAEQAFKLKSPSYAIIEHQYAEMLYLSGSREQAIDMWADMLRRDPTRDAHVFLVRQAVTRWKWIDLLQELDLIT